MLDADCGHQAPSCETKMPVPAIAAFLAQEAPEVLASVQAALARCPLRAPRARAR